MSVPTGAHRAPTRYDAQPMTEQRDRDTDSDSASPAAAVTGGMRKRPRSSNDNTYTASANANANAACDQCRLRKVRCDRRQPECSNCRKAGVECNSSSTLKRVNHTKQFSGPPHSSSSALALTRPDFPRRDDFSVVLKHLEGVDQTLNTLTQLTRQIATRPCLHTTPLHSAVFPSRETTALPSTGCSCNSREDPSISVDHLTANEPLFETVKFDGGGERLYSYPAPLVLIKSLLHQATAALLEPELDQQGQAQTRDNGRETNNAQPLQNHPAARATLQQQLAAFPFDSPCREFVAAGDNNTITTPPRLMLNLFANGYLQNVNTRTPIFDETELYSAIDAHYSDEQPQSRQSMAWAVIINNIVLLELALETQVARGSRSNSHGIDSGILPTFLKNCDRAIGNLDPFMVPSLVNMQALMTLVLVARDFYNNATAERVCHVACQVGRTLGLHRPIARHPGRISDEPNQTPESAKQRERLFWVLYAMDKQRVFMTGQPCDLYSWDSDYQIVPHHSREEADCTISDAFNHMMLVWEDIYVNLYTIRAASAHGETRARQVRLVTSSIDSFAQEHVSPSPPEGVSALEPLQLELLYGYYVSRILALRGQRADEQSDYEIWKLARSSLRLILEVCKAPLTTARLSVLASMFRNYPAVSFVELVAFRLTGLFRGEECDSALHADVNLLQSVCDQLQLLQHDNLTHIFYARLYLGLSWILNTLKAMGEVLSRPSSQPPGAVAPSTPSGGSARSTEPSRNASNAPSPALPIISSACALRTIQANKVLPAQDFVQNGQQGLTNFGFFTSNMDHGNLAPEPLLSSCHFGASIPSLSRSEPEQGHNVPANSNPKWDDFNMDFLQEGIAQQQIWE
ncbi:putative SpoD [Seiridium unicorne]|uniref:SpoD n=1 Tax=Seiridium unicorne TaxID=138068 RepID=A0ABR2VCZ7_9PEZI